MQQKIALIAGTTGLIGNILLRLLLEHEGYEKVISLSRRDPGVSHQKLEKVLTDFDKLDEVQEQLQASHIYCCIGTTAKKAGNDETYRRIDLGYVATLARLGSMQGASHFMVVSSLGANAKSRIFYNKLKGLMEEAVKNVNYEAVHIFRPSFLLGPREESRPGEAAGKAVMQTLSPLMVGGMRKYRPIHAETVARAMAAAAFSPQPGVHIYESDQIARMGKHI